MYTYNHCKCLVPNTYCHPRPEQKRRRFLDLIKVEKFTLNRVKKTCVEECCEEMPVCVSVKDSVLILSSITECIRPDTYYTFDLDRSTPIDFNALQVFMKTEPCGFYHGTVGLEETEVTVHDCGHIDEYFKFTEENLAKFYQAKYNRLYGDQEGRHEFDDTTNHIHDGRQKVERFIEVDLDLRGNIATSGYFLRNERGSNPAYGPKHKYVLYLNNAGRLVLTRDYCETRKYGDFDL